MPLFPPVTDTLRWDDLVRQGRSQLPLVAPGWTDQNTSDPGIALLELLSWLVEADSYRSSAVTDRERRRLLSLDRVLGVRAAGRACPRPAGIDGTAGPGRPGRQGVRSGEAVPLTLVDDVVVRGVTVGTVAWAATGADTVGYRTGCFDLTREHAAGRPIQPLGPDPSRATACWSGWTRAVPWPPARSTSGSWPPRARGRRSLPRPPGRITPRGRRGRRGTARNGPPSQRPIRMTTRPR